MTPRRSFVRPAVLFVLALATTAALPAAAQKRAITETDLFNFVWIADPRISPDGRAVAFVRVTVNEKKDGYDTALWIVPTDGSAPERRLTSGTRDTSPRWSPDGRWLAFLRAVDTNGRQVPQIHLLSMQGGEARKITELARGVSAPEWSPDGARLAFTSTATDQDIDAAQKTGSKPERESDVRVITRAVYRANGGGYLDPTRHSAAWVLSLKPDGTAAGAPLRLTKGDYDVRGLSWTPDGARVLFTSTRVDESYYELPDSDLYSVPATGGELAKVASIDGSIGTAVVSADGRKIAFEGTVNGRPARSFNQSDLFVADLAGGEPKNLTAAYDFDIGGGLTGDQRAPRGGQIDEPIWTPDGKALWVPTTVEGRQNLMRIDATTGAVAPVTKGDQEVVSVTASRDGTRAVLLVSTPTRIGDLFVLDTASGALRQVTKINDALFSQLNLTEPEQIWYTSFDGRKVHTFVQKPPDFDPSKKYPLILNIHGGPHSAYGFTFDHEFQWMAAKGYVVVYPNPRGSTSYGQDFGNVIQYRYPGDDAKDLYAAVDEVVKRGYVDNSRTGVTGGSGGGVLTNWIVTQTDRFAAAVSQRSIADWADFWYTADFSLFQPTWFKAAPWENREDFTSRSAITFIDRVKTPLMLIEGEQDFRTPPAAGGEQMFRALKYLKRPVVMVQFPRETHELSRSGEPWHRIERLQHIVNWFDKYLQGKKTESYD